MCGFRRGGGLLDKVAVCINTVLTELREATLRLIYPPPPPLEEEEEDPPLPTPLTGLHTCIHAFLGSKSRCMPLHKACTHTHILASTTVVLYT